MSSFSSHHTWVQGISSSLEKSSAAQLHLLLQSCQAAADGGQVVMHTGGNRCSINFCCCFCWLLLCPITLLLLLLLLVAPCSCP